MKTFIYCISLFPFTLLTVATYLQLYKLKKNQADKLQKYKPQKSDHIFKANKPHPILYIFLMFILNFGFFWAWYHIPFYDGAPLYNTTLRYTLYFATAFLGFSYLSLYYLNTKLRKAIIEHSLEKIILSYYFFNKSEVIPTKDLHKSMAYEESFFHYSIRITYGELELSPNEFILTLSKENAIRFMNFMTENFSTQFSLETSGD